MSASQPPIGDDDIQAAVEAGVFDAQTADSFRAFVERRRATPSADEESFRLLTGFNDIFVVISVALVLFALGWLGGRATPWLGFASVALASWALSEFFTKRRRMALPSIVLLIAFVAATPATLGGFMVASKVDTSAGPETLGIGAVAVVAAALHWWRFQVPITVASGAAAGVGAILLSLQRWTALGADVQLAFMAVSGLCVFALALGYDASDPLRRTRRSDVAFWLHLLAAPLIVHPLFSMLGVSGPTMSIVSGRLPPFEASHDLRTAVLALGVYLVLGCVALLVDRRALMVSALAYFLFALSSLFRATGALSLSLALAALLVGSGLLLLSAYWAAARRLVLRIAPASWRARLPAA